MAVFAVGRMDSLISFQTVSLPRGAALAANMAAVQVSRISQYLVVPFGGGRVGGGCRTDERGDARVVRSVGFRLFVLGFRSDYRKRNRDQCNQRPARFASTGQTE
jgi:hypothetical protein